MTKYKNTKQQIRLPLVLFIGIAAGVLIGATINNPTTVHKSLKKFREILLHIDSKYVDKVDTEELVDNAIIHILSNLDPHSSYIRAKDKITANESLQGNFEGIGIEFNIFRDTITVISPLSKGPSEAVGVRSGDQIIKIGDKNVAGVGFTNSDVQKHLKGSMGSQVQITVLRKSKKEPIIFNIIRDKIPQSSIDVSYMINEEIGYLKVSKFSTTTYDEFKTAIHSLKKYGMKKLIIDLQGNPGGYMHHAVNIADEFLSGKQKIVYTKGKNKQFNSSLFAEHIGEFEEGNIIVLVNEGSASASEILAGALQDNDRALIVGRRSFGKGLVQTQISLSDGSELRLTISRYYTPSGRSIQKPYGKENREEYADDLVRRYNSGEFFSADSILFNDSLKYETLKGRTVYGGGGIMPDYFVKLDTALNSEYLNELFYSNSMQEFTFKYADENLTRLEDLGYEKYYMEFDVTDKMLHELIAYGEKTGVAPNLDDMQQHKKLFQLHIKAQIARKIWNNEGFYPIFNESNEILQQAIKLFGRAEELNKGNF